MKHFLFGGSKKGDQRKKPELAVDDAKGKHGGFSTLDGCLMIFGGAVAYYSKPCQKLMRHEVYKAKPTMPFFPRWSESAITFVRSDHPKSIL